MTRDSSIVGQVHEFGGITRKQQAWWNRKEGLLKRLRRVVDAYCNFAADYFHSVGLVRHRWDCRE